MAADFPYLYPYSRKDAKIRNELTLWDESFRNNVACARAIEEAIRQHFDDKENTIQSGCAESVLGQYGFKRVNFVLAHTVKELSNTPLISEESRRWGRGIYIPQDKQYARYFAVDTAAPLLEEFIGQTRAAYQALGLFGPEHCLPDSGEQDYEGKVLVLSPNTLREGCWTVRDMLWLAHSGFGCSPHARGRSILATCLGDGEMTRWNRSDFTGVLDERYLPDWAREKLEELQNPQQEQDNGPTMSDMTME